MSQQADDYTRLLQRQLRARLGEKRYGEVFDAILANLEAYGIAREENLTGSPVATVLRTQKSEMDEETHRLLTTLLDHVLRQVTGAAQ
jgi:hypothetical protein